MVIANYPSVVTMPKAEKPFPSIVEFLAKVFPSVSEDQWAQRILEGKVLDDNNVPITAATKYAPSKRLFYFRETENEPVVPFAEEILFHNDQILVACKPHFLPVTPGGRYVQECLVNRLRTRTGIADLVPMHRIDRETAGLVLFSVNKANRGLYHELFTQGKIAKTYLALAQVNQPPQENQWIVENRIVRAEPRFKMKIVPGVANTRSHIQLLEIKNNRGLFSLRPATGKTHQLRLHLSSLGFPILHDRCYPDLQPQTEDDFAKPLQLLAKKIQFQDPVSGEDRCFQSERGLLW